MVKLLILVVIILVIFGIFYLINQLDSAGDKNFANSPLDNPAYTNISAEELRAMLGQKDFKLVDVHIPEQAHIPNTDYFIPYDDIERFVALLPDKKERIVLYCRSGNMSQILAEQLVQRGYTSLFNLEGGMNEWQAVQSPLIPIGSLNN